MLQMRLKGFTFSRLAPYTHWEEFSSEANRLWERYEAVTKPVLVERAAVRYVNRLDLPLPVTDLKRFLTVCPDAPNALGGQTIAYFMQLQQRQTEVDATLVLNESTVPPVRPGVISIILDLDLFSMIKKDMPRPELWPLLTSLHDRVEKVFETCITDDVRGLIE
ncbi:MAG TPA: TIGR04255 family protein [Thermoanaerobaculia bacterium]|nr:TIGR04255 family protein [Thermoanaerobaculia bacterium]